jgi:hypothetical protein
VRASGYRTVLQQVLGSAADGVELLATEYNSVYSNPGKQTTSLVNGLFVADSIGSLLQTEYNGAAFWDLRNSWDTSNNNSPSLYGWRQGGDYGLLGSGNGAPPASGTYVPYPTYFAEQLLSNMLHTGDTVVQAVSADPSLSVYAVLQQDGHLDLLVINKSRDNNLTGQFQLTGFQPDSQAQFWQYGKTEDAAQSHTIDGHSALANFTDTLAVDGSSFSYPFPAYSMTVLDLSPAACGAGGDAWSANRLGSAATRNGNTYALGAAGSPNVVQASGQTIALLAGRFSALRFLAAAVNGNHPEPTFTVTYTDGATQTFTQSLSDWAFPQGYSGESIVVTMPYQDRGDGIRDDSLLFHVYAYSFALDSGNTVPTITLPNDGNVRLLTITLMP